MFGQSTTGAEALTDAGSRVFRIEFSGMVNPLESLATSKMVRRSVQSVTVPYSRMSAEVQRILKMGGAITTISPVGSTADPAAEPAE